MFGDLGRVVLLDYGRDVRYLDRRAVGGHSPLGFLAHSTEEIWVAGLRHFAYDCGLFDLGL